MGLNIPNAFVCFTLNLQAKRPRKQSCGVRRHRTNTGGKTMENQRRSKVHFETLSSEKIGFGKSNFLEVARKKATTEEGEENEFISLSRGYYLDDGTARFKKSLTIPDDPEIKDFVAEKIKTL